MFPATVYDLGQARLADLRRQAQRDALARAVRRFRLVTGPHATSSRAGTPAGPAGRRRPLSPPPAAQPAHGLTSRPRSTER